MITILYWIMLSTLLLIAIIKSINPVKIRIILIMLRNFLFLNLFLKRRISWFPTIFLIIFTGGILMIFIIVSSIIPNQKPIKFKISMTVLIARSIIALIEMKNTKELTTTFRSLKWNMERIFYIARLTSLIILYFFTFIRILSIEKRSMRSII